MNRTTANYECLMNKEHEACQVYLDCLSKCIQKKAVYVSFFYTRFPKLTLLAIETQNSSF